MGAIDEPQSARPSALNAALSLWGIVLCICRGRPRVYCNKCIKRLTHQWMVTALLRTLALQAAIDAIARAAWA